MRKRISLVILFILCPFLLLRSQEKGWEPLFNGKDLSNWDKFLGPSFPGHEELAKGATTDNVFSVKELNSEKMISISGEVHGSIATKDSFSNYHLRLMYKWGEKVTQGRNSGLLYHSYGSFGASYWTWMASIECQMMHDNPGDCYMMVDAITCEAEVVISQDKQYYYKHGADKLQFSESVKRRMIKKTDNYERPLGEWNTIDLYCLGQTALHMVNGKTVMVIQNISTVKDGILKPLTGGKIQIQSEGAELFIKSIKVEPIKQIPGQLLEN